MTEKTNPHFMHDIFSSVDVLKCLKIMPQNTSFSCHDDKKIHIHFHTISLQITHYGQKSVNLLHFTIVNILSQHHYSFPVGVLKSLGELYTTKQF